MAVLVRPTNGVSYGVKYTITSADVTAGNVVFDFRKNGVGTYRYDLVASATLTSSAGVQIAQTTTLLTITYPIQGQVEVAGTFTAGDILQLVVQPALTGITVTP